MLFKAGEYSLRLMAQAMAGGGKPAPEEYGNMEDNYGRMIDYMRISITDRCNLRCKYCMPDGAECVDRREILTLEEIRAVAMAAAALGIRHIRVTGGEPLVRADCCSLVAMLKKIPGIETVTATTNGVLLERYLEPLLEAGIDGINISLDTLDRELYQEITGQDELEAVVSVVRRAASLPVPVKVNVVSLDLKELAAERGRALQDTGWRPLAELARDNPVDVRFIEVMPIGYGRLPEAIGHGRLLEELRQAYPDMEPDARIHGFGPAVYYRIPGFLGSIGLISAVHGKFCAGCNRIRLTSQGYLKACLCYEDGVDLRGILRGGQREPEEDMHCNRISGEQAAAPGLQRRLQQAIVQAVRKKPAAHCFENPEEITESRSMVSIGG